MACCVREVYRDWLDQVSKFPVRFVYRIRYTMQDQSAFLRCLGRNSIKEGLEVAQQLGPHERTRYRRLKSVTDSSPIVAVDSQ